MQKQQRISEAEWQVMEVLWSHGPCATAQVLGHLPGGKWSRNTVHTFLTRLEGKGAVTSEMGEHGRIFTAVISRESCRREENRSFLQRVYHGSVGAMMKNFLQEEQLSREEIDQLRKLLDEAEQREGGE